jgi:hypothetical protein
MNGPSGRAASTNRYSADSVCVEPMTMNRRDLVRDTDTLNVSSVSS